MSSFIITLPVEQNPTMLQAIASTETPKKYRNIFPLVYQAYGALEVVQTPSYRFNILEMDCISRQTH